MHGMSIREAFGEKLAKPINGGLLQWHEGVSLSPRSQSTFRRRKNRRIRIH